MAGGYSIAGRSARVKAVREILQRQPHLGCEAIAEIVRRDYGLELQKTRAHEIAYDLGWIRLYLWNLERIEAEERDEDDVRRAICEIIKADRSVNRKEIPGLVSARLGRRVYTTHVFRVLSELGVKRERSWAPNSDLSRLLVKGEIPDA